MWLQQTEEQMCMFSAEIRFRNLGLFSQLPFIFHSTVRSFSSHTDIFFKTKIRGKKKKTKKKENPT